MEGNKLKGNSLCLYFKMLFPFFIKGLSVKAEPRALTQMLFIKSQSTLQQGYQLRLGID